MKQKKMARVKLRAGQCGLNRVGRRFCVLPDGIGARYVGRDFDPVAEGLEIVPLEPEISEEELEPEVDPSIPALVDQVNRLERAIGGLIDRVGDVDDSEEEGEDEDDEEDPWASGQLSDPPRLFRRLGARFRQRDNGRRTARNPNQSKGLEGSRR